MFTRRVTTLDQAAGAWLWRHRPRRGRRLAEAVSALAEPYVAYPTIVLARAVAATRHRRTPRTPTLVAVATVASGMLARRALSRRIARPRPPRLLWLTTPEGFSLPSKHTTLAVLTAAACAEAVTASPAARLTAPLLAGALVGGGRVWLGVHWPGDVLAGTIFGLAW